MNETTRDEIISQLWVLAPLIATMAALVPTIILIFAGSTAGSLIFVAGLILSLALFIYLNYKLINRMNRHIVREAEVRRVMIDRVVADSLERGTSAAVEPYISALEGIDQHARLTEAPRSTLWSLVMLIPIIGLVLYFYMLYFLSKFAFEHDDRWYAFATNIHLASRINGLVVPPPLPKYPQERSFVLFLLLTVLFNPFVIYWYLKLIDDPNDHFREMWAFEDSFWSNWRGGSTMMATFLGRR